MWYPYHNLIVAKLHHELSIKYGIFCDIKIIVKQNYSTQPTLEHLKVNTPSQFTAGFKYGRD